MRKYFVSYEYSDLSTSGVRTTGKGDSIITTRGRLREEDINNFKIEMHGARFSSIHITFIFKL